MKFGDFIDQFLAFEKREGLYDIRIQNLSCWTMIRFQLQRKLAIQLGINESAHDSYGHGLLFFFKRLWSNLRRMIVRNPFRASGADIFIFGHPRRQCIDGVWMDVYTDLLKERLDKENITYQDFEPVYREAFSPLHAASHNILYLDLIEGLGWLATFFPLHISEEEQKTIHDLENALQKEFGIVYNLLPLLKKIVRQYRMYAWCFSLLFARVKPKIILEVGSYGYLYQALHASAKKYNIPTIELQHGALSRYHLGYTYTDRELCDPILPGTIFTFGEFRHSLITMPACVTLQAIGYPFFDFQKQISHDMEQGEYNIVVISQGAIGKPLSKFIVDLADQLDKKYHICYKLHPGEFEKAKTDYSDLYTRGNITVVSSEKTVYDLFTTCSILIGLGSTAIYEGLGYGLYTILVDLAGVEYMDDVIDQGLACKVNKVEDCLTLLEEKQGPTGQAELFFKQDALDNMINNLTAMIAEIEK